MNKTEKALVDALWDHGHEPAGRRIHPNSWTFIRERKVNPGRRRPLNNSGHQWLKRLGEFHLGGEHPAVKALRQTRRR